MQRETFMWHSSFPSRTEGPSQAGQKYLTHIVALLLEIWPRIPIRKTGIISCTGSQHLLQVLLQFLGLRPRPQSLHTFLTSFSTTGRLLRAMVAHSSVLQGSSPHLAQACWVFLVRLHFLLAYVP